MDRREFSKVMGAVVAGMVAGSRAFAEEKTPAAGKKAADTKDKNVCKGYNECKGKGGCKTDKNSCKGQNSCKAQGGCKTS